MTDSIFIRIIVTPINFLPMALSATTYIGSVSMEPIEISLVINGGGFSCAELEELLTSYGLLDDDYDDDDYYDDDGYCDDDYDDYDDDDYCDDYDDDDYDDDDYDDYDDYGDVGFFW